MLHTFRRYFSLWEISKPDIEAFIEQANLHHPTIKFTAETFDTETAFLDTAVYKGARVKEKSILDAKTHILNKWKPSCTHNLPHVTLQMLKNSSETTLSKIIQIKKKRLINGGWK